MPRNYGKMTTDDQFMIYSWRRIGGCLGVSHQTARTWSENHGLPVAKMPNGQVATSKSLIDQWLLTRHVSKGGRLAKGPAPDTP